MSPRVKQNFVEPDPIMQSFIKQILVKQIFIIGSGIEQAFLQEVLINPGVVKANLVKQTTVYSGVIEGVKQLANCHPVGTRLRLDE